MAVTTDDLATYLGVSDIDEGRAQMLIDDAFAQAVSIATIGTITPPAGATWVNLPAGADGIIRAAVGRRYSNVSGVTSGDGRTVQRFDASGIRCAVLNRRTGSTTPACWPWWCLQRRHDAALCSLRPRRPADARHRRRGGSRPRRSHRPVTAALYLHKAPQCGDLELRYSLRTVHKIGVDEVYIVGDMPEWAKGIHHIPEKPSCKQDKFARLWDALSTAVHSYNLPERFILMNDDYHVLQPYEPQVEHRGYLEVQIGHKRPLNIFFQSIANTLDYLQRDCDIREPWSYETHRPLPMYKSAVAYAMDAAKNWNGGTLCGRTVWGNLYDKGATVRHTT